MRHLLSIADLSPDEIDEVLQVTDSFVEVSERAIPKVPTLRGRTVVSLFYEESTRTRLSFETAAKRLSADTMNFSVSTSSVKKGESLRDTVETIEAMGIDVVVVRHASAGVPWQVARWVDASVINAGDGWHEHPTQALLDCYTIRQQRGSLAGLRIAIVGDVKHFARGALERSRVHDARRRGHSGCAADPAAAEHGWLARRRQPRPRRGAAQGRRRLPAAHAERAPDRIAAALARASTPLATVSPESGRASCPTTRSSCTPDP